MTTNTEETQEIQEPKILRTSQDGCWEVYDGPWGKYLRSAFDPEANAVITEDHLKTFELKEDIHRIPSELWAKWVKLCFYYVDKVQSSVEVSMRILRSETDPSNYRFLIPKQKVSGASVRVDSFDEAIDIDTGEEIAQYPPEGWVPVGSSHSHNTMQAFFSGVDDQYELGDPGIHIVVGSIDTKNMKYTIAASVVGSGRRFQVPFDKLIDAIPVEGVEFNQKVLDYVDYSTPVTTYSTKGKPVTTSSSWKKKESKSTSTNDSWFDMKNWGWDTVDDYNDPFYWSSEFNNQSINHWNVIDTAKDFVSQNRNKISELNELKEELYDFLSDLEILIGDDVLETV